MSINFRIAVLPGDGVGAEVTREAVRVLHACGASFGVHVETQEYAAGGMAIDQFGSPLPQATINACLQSDAVLLGALGGPQYDSLPRPMRPETGLLALRKALGGFANLRPAVAYPQLASCSPLKSEVTRGADVLIVRELLGGLYFGTPRGVTDDPDARGVNTMSYTRSQIERVVRLAFEVARTRRKKITSVDKCNILETSQLWRDTVNALAVEYRDVELEHILVDACALKLMTFPRSFDVIVTENLFGDILSDEAAALTGSLGMLPSATIGGAVDLYEPVHGSAPDIAGRGIANPLGAIASIAMLFRYTVKNEPAAIAIEHAIETVLNAGHRTVDIAVAGTRTVSTAEMGALVAQTIETRAAAKA
jgi:3-isopropylmalate dehydrogenase